MKKSTLLLHRQLRDESATNEKKLSREKRRLKHICTAVAPSAGKQMRIVTFCYEIVIKSAKLRSDARIF